MNDYLIREFRAGDAPALSLLWQQVFGDPAELVDGFLERLPQLGAGAVAEYMGAAVGAAYALCDLELIQPGKAPRRGGYIYAVAVAPEQRHGGLGRQLCQHAAELARELGAEFICTLPAEPGLYDWYREIMGLETALYRRHLTVESRAGAACRELSGEEYLRQREELLEGTCHLRPGRALTDFAADFYRCFGGGLYAVGDSLVAAYGEGGQLFIKELITPPGDRAESCAGALGAALGAKRVTYFMPAEKGQAYLAAEPESIPADCVWNLSFD